MNAKQATKVREAIRKSIHLHVNYSCDSYHFTWIRKVLRNDPNGEKPQSAYNNLFANNYWGGYLLQ